MTANRTLTWQARLVAVGIALAAASSATGADEDFESIFDARTLNGWHGQDMSFWSIEDGAITGSITPDHAPTMNQYLEWDGGLIEDFELKLRFRLTGSKTPVTNGGFQFRSRRLPDGDVAGYQVDNNFGQPWKVRLYDEHGRHDLALEGEQTEFDADGTKRTQKLALAPGASEFALDTWHEYHLLARGPQLELRVNGRVVARAADRDDESFEPAGILALQLHTGPPMKAQFKDIRLKRLTPARPLSRRERTLAGAALHWQLGERSGSHQPPLKAEGDIQPGIAAAGEGARPHEKVARLKRAWFDAGKAWQSTGTALTVYVRVRAPNDLWNSALLAKGGGTDHLHFILFCRDLGATPGEDVGFQFRTETGVYLAASPLAAAVPGAWHNFAARYDGQRVQLLCDGKITAVGPGNGRLVPNDQPLLIGAETDDDRVVGGFTGEISETALWTRALTDAELTAVMH